MLAGKWVELLKEIAPSLVRIAVIKMPQHATNAKLFQSAQIVATSLNVELIDASIRSPADIENAVAMIADKPDSGLLVLPSPPRGLIDSNASRLAAAVVDELDSYWSLSCRRSHRQMSAGHHRRATKNRGADFVSNP